jgi:metal-responsive CopG/Arc/MetJ family transcriptional regulator
MTTITCKIPAKLKAQLEAAARAQGIAKSRIVREALENQLKRRSSNRRIRAIDLVKHLAGAIRGPADLSRNPLYLEDLGA